MILAIVHTIHKYSVLNICKELTTTFYYGTDFNGYSGLLNMNDVLVCNWRMSKFGHIRNLFTGRHIYGDIGFVRLPKRYL